MAQRASLSSEAGGQGGERRQSTVLCRIARKMLTKGGVDDEDALVLNRRSVLDDDVVRRMLEPSAGLSPRRGLRLQEHRERLVSTLRSRWNGSALRGWRHDLDPDGELELPQVDLVNAVAKLHLIDFDPTELISPRKVPQALSLEELLPKEGELVHRFREWMEATFGGPSGMFAEFCSAGQRKMTLDQFVAGCEKYAQQFEATRDTLIQIFEVLDIDGCNAVTQEEIMFLETDKKTRSLEIFKLKVSSTYQRQRLMAEVHVESKQLHPKKRLAERPWHAETFESLPTIASQKKLGYQHQYQRRCREACQAFMKHLIATYGSQIRAWRRGIDPEGLFTTDARTIRSYVRSRDLQIDTAALWVGLDKDKDGIVRMEELGTRQSLSLAIFRHWAHKRFGSCVELWNQPLALSARQDTDINKAWVSHKKMKVGAFMNVLKALNLPGSGDPERDRLLGPALDLYGCGFVSIEDMAWLDKWDPPGWLMDHPDPDAWKQLRDLILSHCEQPLLAWRMLLDTDGNNLVCWTEFQEACHRVGFEGSTAAAWRCLDQDALGVITLRNYDAESSDLLTSFKKWCEEYFGSVTLAFKAFDDDGSDRVTFAEMKRACHKWHWQGEVKLLFNCLGLNAGLEGGVRALKQSDIAWLDGWSDENPVALSLDSPRLALMSTPQLETVTAPGTEHSAVAVRPATTGTMPVRRGGDGDKKVFTRLFQDSVTRTAKADKQIAEKESQLRAPPREQYSRPASAAHSAKRTQRAYSCTAIPDVTWKTHGPPRRVRRPSSRPLPWLEHICQ